MKKLVLKQRILYGTLLFAIILLVMDRTAAWLYIPEAGDKAVVIYTTKTCPYCVQLRKHLNSNQVPYEDRDIYTDVKGILGFWALRGRGVPVSAVGEDVVYGYQLDKINHSLRKLGFRLK